MCSVCGDTGYKPAAQYGSGHGSSDGATIWADHVVMEPCDCQRLKWSPVYPHFPQPIFAPLPAE